MTSMGRHTLLSAIVLSLLIAPFTGALAFAQLGSGPAPWFHFAPSAPGPGDSVHLDASPSEGEGGIVSYQWDTTGDGFPDRAGREITLSFPRAGQYPVTLTVHDGLGRSSSVTRTIQVGQGGVELRINSWPSDLTVYIDGENRGRTPLELTVDPGIRNIRIRHYWMGEWEADLDLRKLSSLFLEVSLRSGS